MLPATFIAIWRFLKFPSFPMFGSVPPPYMLGCMLITVYGSCMWLTCMHTVPSTFQKKPSVNHIGSSTSHQWVNRRQYYGILWILWTFFFSFLIFGLYCLFSRWLWLETWCLSFRLHFRCCLVTSQLPRETTRSSRVRCAEGHAPRSRGGHQMAPF